MTGLYTDHEQAEDAGNSREALRWVPGGFCLPARTEAACVGLVASSRFRVFEYLGRVVEGCRGFQYGLHGVFPSDQSTSLASRRSHEPSPAHTGHLQNAKTPTQNGSGSPVAERGLGGHTGAAPQCLPCKI
jgi:hypothetical protein